MIVWYIELVVCPSVRRNVRIAEHCCYGPLRTMELYAVVMLSSFVTMNTGIISVASSKLRNINSLT